VLRRLEKGSGSLTCRQTASLRSTGTIAANIETGLSEISGGPRRARGSSSRGETLVTSTADPPVACENLAAEWCKAAGFAGQMRSRACWHASKWGVSYLVYEGVEVQPIGGADAVGSLRERVCDQPGHLSFKSLPSLIKIQRLCFQERHDRALKISGPFSLLLALLSWLLLPQVLQQLFGSPTT
jgi:hypothetical protein